MEITYKKYGTTMYFAGSDGIDDTKGIIDEDKPIKLVVLDELTEFFDDGEGEDELTNIEATFVRGNKGGFQMIYLYNPPKNPNAPINLWCKKMEKREDCIHIHTDYRDVPVDWLGPDLIASAEMMKKADPKSQTGLIKEVDMSLRVEQHSKAINDDLNYLSLKCGFGTERYRFDGAGAKTATEIISENSDMYRMLKKHEIILEDVIKRLVRIIIRLGIVTGNTLDQNTDIVIDFDDSIIEDKGAERQQDRQDVSMGVMRHEEYRAKWYGETVEQAKKNLPEQNQVME